MALGLDLTTGGTGFIIVTFIIGLLLGIVVKRVFKLALAIVALIVVLVVTGYVNLNWNQSQISGQTIYRVYSYIPGVVSTIQQVATLLPLTSAAFLAGIALGLWKG